MNLKKIDSHSKRELGKIKSIVKKIEHYDSIMQSLSDDELKAKTLGFKQMYKDGKSLDKILPEAYAVVREAAYRVLGLKPYMVQIEGAIILYQGRIAEMKTGEGKTLVAAMPSYLMGITGKGVHVVTVNDYLVSRDAATIGQIHEFLGLTVGHVVSNMSTNDRKAAYACDITYVTNNELGFDYLRDNMAQNRNSVVQRGLHYAIIDEVDSILIDEARTPLIISGMSGKSTELYSMCNYLAQNLERGESSGELTKMDIINGNEIVETGDFIVDEKDKIIHLTDRGVKKVETFFHLKNFADADNVDIQHNMIVALKAHYLMHKDKDYVVKDNEVLIVDEFTGRIMDGRRYSDGLHQAIEAKEGVTINQESVTLATITFQNFFNKYERKSGMTGTAMTEAKEFRDIYNMDVVSVPTNKPIARNDLDDSVYLTKEAKYKAIIAAIEKAHSKGQPVLVGTVTIDVSEKLSHMLKQKGIVHNVLNAKYHEREAEIISHAGEYGAVTIATNMAGRGTDIKLDDKALDAGGLFVIGTEKHESRRIDNQLRGRSGRQGDVGTSKFYISLEDDVMRLFGSERLLTMFANLDIESDSAIQHKAISSMIMKAQEKIEGNNYGIRKNLMDYDMVNNQQREIIYAQRNAILCNDDLSNVIMTMRKNVVDDLITQYCQNAVTDDNLAKLWVDLKDVVSSKYSLTYDKFEKNIKVLHKSILQDLNSLYDEHMSSFSDNEVHEIERYVLLRTIDSYWIRHIDDLEQLRQSISLIGYGQKDPVVEYKLAAYDMFDVMFKNIQKSTLKMIFRAKIENHENKES